MNPLSATGAFTAPQGMMVQYDCKKMGKEPCESTAQWTHVHCDSSLLSLLAAHSKNHSIWEAEEPFNRVEYLLLLLEMRKLQY